MLPDSILPAPEDDVARILEDYKKRISHLETLEQAGAVSIGARVFNSANISIPTAAVTTLTFDSERFDTDSIHSTVVNTDRLTAQTAGIYQISGTVAFATNATGSRVLYFDHSADGSIAIHVHNRVDGSGAFNGVARLTQSTLYELAVDEFVIMRVRQDSGGALNVLRTASYTPEFMMARVG